MIYKLWYIPNFPLGLLTIKPAAADTEPKWSSGFLADIKENGLRNPLVVDGHTSLRQYIVMVGNNRHWAARKLGWDTVPAVVSYPKGLSLAHLGGREVADAQACFEDGIVYMNHMGWGVHSAPPPEKNY